VDSESEDYTPAELLAEAIDAAEVCRLFLITAHDTDPPSYDAALEYIEIVIGHLEEAQDKLRGRLANRNATTS
jgi:hypothetical protein